MNDNNDKLVFELKDLSYSDLVSLYRDIIAFNEHVDGIITEVSEVKEEELPAESTNTSEDGEVTSKEENTEGEKSEEASASDGSSGGEQVENSDQSNNTETQGENNTEVKPENSTEEAK